MNDDERLARQRGQLTNPLLDEPSKDCQHKSLTKVTYATHTWICTTDEHPECHFVVVDRKAVYKKCPPPSKETQQKGTQARVKQQEKARQERWDDIRTLRDRGYNADKIATALGVSSGAVSRQAYHCGDVEMGRFFNNTDSERARRRAQGKRKRMTRVQAAAARKAKKIT